jgi:hypothetical protein
MKRSIWARVALVLCSLLVAVSVPSQAQSLFYANDLDTGFDYPTAHEIADDILFAGLYRVEGFQFQYVLPGNDSTDVTVRFYGVDPIGGGHGDLVTSFTFTGLPSGVHVVSRDLNATGGAFLWSDSGEEYGWVSLQFSNPNAGWATATGGGSGDVFEDITEELFLDFGGEPEASFYMTVAGAAVPEPGVFALLASALVPCWYLARRRKG